MLKNYILLFTVVFFNCFQNMQAQHIRMFTVKDFDLKHQVKKCLVNTKYGKEEYDFDKNGFLTKSVTRFNDMDYDVVHYKYREGELIEKRSESYRDNVFDSNTSIAHFYQIDTTINRRITEKIVSYEKEFLDQYVYEYDDKGDLIRIVRTNNEGTDETLIEYKKYKGEFTITYLLNDVPLKSIRTSIQRKRDRSVQKMVLTKEYLKGEANNAFEEVFDESEKLLARQEFDYDKEEKTFVPTARTTYIYNENGILAQEVITKGDVPEKKEYIYQFDDEDEKEGNWIKQIITPDNSYITRKIMYYKEESPVVEEE
ncbi:hypothetical protein [Maribacter sp. 2304DJ31-5]|uniref:hypothetical protein n=1 Tax=Maribacter sp. 2304DJ31-5 TaxID=3386273 RepID=UPI0039BD73B2